jgi:hypothetical protein
MDPVLLEALTAAAVSLGGATANDQAWRKGDLTHLFHAGQKKIDHVFETSPHQVQVVLCARGFGKTFWGAAKATSKALQRKARVKIATEFQTDLENLILPNFDTVLESCPDDIAPRWMPSKSRFVTDSGSAIDLIGLDRKPQGLRGQHNVDLIILEEAGFITKLEQIFRSVIVPITTHRKDCKIVLITTPPESLDHYFWQLHDMAEAAGALTVLTIDDNPMLTPADVKRIEEQMGGRTSTQFRREYLCERVSEESRMLVPEFSEARHVVTPPRDEFFPFYLKSNALDSGVRDLTTSLWGYYDFRQAKLIVEGELVLSGREVLTRTIFNRTREVESSLSYQKVRRHADNNNLILIQDLNQLANDAKIESGNPDPAVHWVPTRKDSVEASINLVRTWFNEDRILISPECRHTIGTLKTALWNKQRTDFQRSEVYGHADAIMSLCYLIRNLDTHTNPIPRTYGADLNNSIVFERKQQSENARALAQAFGIKRS